WPALGAIRRRRLRSFETEDELTAALALAFTSLVARVDLRRTRRVAATLVMGTERDVMKAMLRARKSAACGEVVSAEAVPWAQAHGPSAHDVFGGLSLKSELGALRAWLLPFAGEDTELVMSVLVQEESYAEVGARLGLAPAAARKRFHRALGRLRKMAFKIPEKDFLSQIGSRGCL
ncbi:sigma-70 family RNA polymerase sigma factor, partial [Corallococcus sp. M34]|nr:sigma-70 family RNA polymerase sigma factor [Citreicoccus inhibens]